MTAPQPHVPVRYLLQARQDADTTGIDDGSRSWHPVAGPLAGLLVLLVLVAFHKIWSAQLLLVPCLLILPGVILLRALRVTGAAIAKQPGYIPSASLLVLMFSGLCTDVIGPIFGISQPLHAAPLLGGLIIVLLVVIACSVNAPTDTKIAWQTFSRPGKLAWPFVIPVVAGVGALRLNSGHTNHAAILAIVLTLILLVGAFLLAPQQDDAILIVIVYATGLAMSWSFSLRGDSVYGFDITSEYNSLQQTVTAGIWHFSHPNDAYGAMLSLTVLPAELHSLTGVPDLLIFKVIYPVIGAMFPVGVYSLSRLMLGRRWAFMAASLLIMQYTFFQQFPALARQEIGTLFFATLIAAMLDAGLARRPRLLLTGLLTAGMVVSHYSTTYLAIPVFGIGVVLQLVLSCFRSVPRVTGAVLLAFLGSLIGAGVWYGLITHSTSNISGFASLAQAQGINLLPNSSKSGNILSNYLQGELSHSLAPTQYQESIGAYYKLNIPYVHPLPDASEPQYNLQAASDPRPPVRLALGVSGANLVVLLTQQFMNVLAAAGALILVFRRRAPMIARQIGLIGLGAVAILILTRISGTIAQEYNPQRAFLQSMIVLGTGICIIFQLLGARWRRTRTPILVVGALSLGVFFAQSAGLTAITFGGATDTNLANKFDDYQDFDMATVELASASWLKEVVPPGSLIYADRYAELRLYIEGFSPTGILNDVTPLTIDQHSWIFADRTNTLDGITRSDEGLDSATYAFPENFLNTNFNKVYTNGSAEVFHR